MRSLRPVMCGGVTGLLTLALLAGTTSAQANTEPVEPTDPNWSTSGPTEPGDNSDDGGVTAQSDDGVSAKAARPSDGVVHVLGKGYGHGRGLSQWGARNAAAKGVGYKKILSFYYPGTRLRKSRAPRSLRVRLGHRGTPIYVKPERRMTLFWTAQNRAVRKRTLPTRIGRCGVSMWRVSRVRRVDLTLHARTCGRWRTYLAYNQVWGGGRISFSPRDGAFLIGRHRPGSTPTHREYRGELRTTIRKGSLRAINLVPYEQYLRAVVPSESPASWPREALKAQAIAARTYARWNAIHPRGSYFDVYDTTSSQKYPGRRELTSKWRTRRTFEYRSTDAVIRATRDVIVTYRGRPAFTEYSASNGGRTVRGSFPYVRARKDPWDRGVQWKTSIRAQNVEQRYPAIGSLERIQLDTRNGEGPWGGRVEAVTLVGDQGSETIQGQGRVYSALGLRSALFAFRAGG